jgi:hypothetical protein
MLRLAATMVLLFRSQIKIVRATSYSVASGALAYALQTSFNYGAGVLNLHLVTLVDVIFVFETLRCQSYFSVWLYVS